MLPALALSIAYLVWEPPSADLAAQTFRTELFEQHGLAVWSGAWYGGFHPLGYSLLFPPLAALLGPRLVGVLAVVAATWFFAQLVRPRYGDRARLAIWLFGAGAATNLFTGRLTFALGVAIGLGALLLVERRRPLGAGVLGAVTSAASPVAGLFTGFAGAMLFVRGRRRDGIALAAPALAAIALLALLFPTGGVHPFLGDTFALITAATLLLVLVLPTEERTLRLGAALYAALCVAVFLVDSPLGGNVTRLGALAAAPLLALGAWGRRPTALVVAALVPLLYWQWVAPVRDLSDAVGEPSTERAYYEPLLAELERLAPDEPYRVHVPATRNRWEAAFVAAEHPLARGWLRQAESRDFELFQDGKLTPGTYREWLDERAVAFVAVSKGAEPDYLAEDELELIRAGLPYLEPRWGNDDWELYAVRDAAPLAAAPAEIGDGGFALIARTSRDEIPVAVRFSPYFEPTGKACVRRGDGGWSVVEPRAPGRIAVAADLTAGGVGRALSGATRVCASD